MSDTRRIVAVVSSFRPAPGLVANLQILSRQVDRVVVVDDGSGSEYDAVMGRASDVADEVVRLAENVGIAAALNVGLRAAELAPDDLAVMFDQDSRVPDGFVTALVRQWDAGVRAGLAMGMVSPETFAGVPQVQRGADGRGMLHAVEPIQSGSLVSGEVLAAAGLLREDLFIDLVDKEYYLRLRRLGRTCLAVPGLDLPHELGRTYALTLCGREVRVLGRRLTLSISAPFRYYYRARNRVIVNRVYWRDSRSLLTKDTLLELRHLVLVWVSASRRSDFARLVTRGVRDGRRARMGRMPDDVAQLAAGIRWRIEPL